MADIQFIPRARAEYSDSLQWYARQSTRAATRFEGGVGRLLDAILAMPEMYPIRDDDRREALVPGFPCVVLYRVEADRSVLVVSSPTPPAAREQSSPCHGALTKS